MANPFVPGFGLSPHVLVGREQFLSDVESGLSAGPSDQRFTTLVTGVRGSGKTVALEAIQDSMEQHGWLVLQVDATTSGLPIRIIEAVQQAERRYERDASTRRRTGSRLSGLSVAGFGINWAEVNESPLPATGSAMAHLTALADSAQKAGTSVLLTIDELQGVEQEEFRRLAADIQHITSRKQLPLALVAAGLPQVKTTLLSDKKTTFLQRCHKMEVPPLSRTDALQGLNLTIKAAGGTIEPDALSAAAFAVQGSPYRLQLLGYNAWKISGAPSAPIGLVAVNEAARISDATITENVSLPAWYDLNDSSQSFLESLVASDTGPPTASEIAALMGISTRHARRIGRALELSGYIIVTTNGRMSLSDLVPAEVVRAEAELIRPDPHETRAESARTTSGKARCGKYMPRANTVCVLGSGHAGPHRSKT